MIADSISRRLPVLFVLTVVVVLGITGTLVAATVFWSANEIDIASVQRETRRVRKLLEDRIAQITKDQRATERSLEDIEADIQEAYEKHLY